MELSEITRLFREQADDTAAPYLVSDEVAFLYAAEGEKEAAIRARLIRQTGGALATFAVAANQQTITLDPRIFWVEDAEFQATSGGRPRRLDPKGMDWIRDQCDWQGRTSRPDYFVHDDRSVRMWPTPSQAGTLTLTVHREPLYPMEDGADEPEIPQQHHEGLVQWMLYRAYSQKDSEIYDPQRAQPAYQRFVELFGERDSANVMRRHRDRRRITTRPI